MAIADHAHSPTNKILRAKRRIIPSREPRRLLISVII
jgi:hypothetical protein